MRRMGSPLLLLCVLTTSLAASALDWPTLRGNAQRTGYVDTPLPRGLHLSWAVELEGERLGTAMEPIVGGGLVFVATHAGRLWALDAATGSARWNFHTRSPLLHSPAFAEGRVYSATADGRIFAVDGRTGRLVWNYEGDREGYAASPLPFQDLLLLGSRRGTFVALDLETGIPAWERHFDIPIRQSAAADEGRVWITLEDLTLHCLSLENGRTLWKSTAAEGQSARDYFPVLTRRDGGRRVLLRTSPSLNMAQRIARDRDVLTRQAGLAEADWRRIEAWCTNATSDASPEASARELTAIHAHLERDPDARTAFLWDADTGKARDVVPLLWLGGCQGVATPPVVFPDGRLLTPLRSAYGHWTLGVAPLVGVGFLDPASNRLELLNQRSGPKPPWNTFWGTADEALHLVGFRDAVVIVHQATLSRFDPASGRLETLLGNRDTHGGFQAPAWARNEWHGPARGGVAWADGRLHWLVGSRILSLSTGPEKPPRQPRTHASTEIPSSGRLPARTSLSREELGDELVEAVRELTSGPWAPLVVEPGLGGRSVFFDNPGDLLETIAKVWPHLDSGPRARLESWLPLGGLKGHGPFSQPPWRTPGDGDRRELHRMPRENLRRLPIDRSPTAFGNVAAIVGWCRLTDPSGLDDLWPELEMLWDDFKERSWHLDPARGDLFANRYLASLLAFAQVAREQEEPETAEAAQELARETTDALIAWWERTAREIGTLPWNGSRDVDAFIGSGNGLFLRIAPHRHRLALFHDLTPALGNLLRERCPAAVDTVWRAFEKLCPTWWLVGEERQVHSGENFTDTPDFAMGAFRAFAYLRHTPYEELAARVDVPAARGDLFRLAKLAIALDAAARSTP